MCLNLKKNHNKWQKQKEKKEGILNKTRQSRDVDYIQTSWKR